MPKPDMNPRTCIVSREEKTPDEMIRFVLDPQDNVVPDLKRKLPGRGVWVSSKRATVSQAVDKKAFAHGFKKQVIADVGLPDLVDRLLEREALNILALARKAGEAITGFMKVDGLIRSEEIAVLVHAADASEDGKGKLAQGLRVAELDDVPVFETFEGQKLDDVLGNANTVHIGLIAGGLASRFEAAMSRLLEYRGLTEE
ncbi:MAG: RNA-binding protein [Rhizobiaceae bacterium]|nr:RNA-binding protein [Rhizobiaceae bacterium]